MRLQKNVDMASNLRNAIWALPYLIVKGLIWGYLADGSSGAWVGLVAAILVSAMVGFAKSILDGAPVKSAVNTLYGLGRQAMGNRKRPAGDLNLVRYHKSRAV